MTTYVLSWIAFACPGGLLNGLWPATIRPLVCKSEPQFKIYDITEYARAKKKALELGEPTQLSRCRGTDDCEELIEWVKIAKFKGEPQ